MERVWNGYRTDTERERERVWNGYRTRSVKRSLLGFFWSVLYFDSFSWCMHLGVDCACSEKPFRASLMTYHIVWHIRNPECTQMIPAWRLPVLTLMNINYCLNHDLSNVYEWLSAKTEFMLITSRQKLSQFTESPSLIINENAIEEVRSAKSLGVYVDQNINCECHIENISKKSEFGTSLHLMF